MADHKHNLDQGTANGGARSKSTGTNLEQGTGNGGRTRQTPSARWGKGNPKRDRGNAAKAGDNLTPPRRDVAGKNSPQRGGHNRVGHATGMRVGTPSGSHLIPPGKV